MKRFILNVLTFLVVGLLAYFLFSKIKEAQRLDAMVYQLEQEVVTALAVKDSLQQEAKTYQVQLTEAVEQGKEKDLTIARLQAKKEEQVAQVATLTPDVSVNLFNKLTGDTLSEAALVGDLVLSPLERIKIANQIMINERYLAGEVQLYQERLLLKDKEVEAVTDLYQNSQQQLKQEEAVSERLREQLLISQDRESNSKQKAILLGVLGLVLGGIIF